MENFFFIFGNFFLVFDYLFLVCSSMKNKSNTAKYEKTSRSTCLKPISLYLEYLTETRILGTRSITNILFVYLSRRSQNTLEQYTV